MSKTENNCSIFVCDNGNSTTTTHPTIEAEKPLTKTKYPRNFAIYNESTYIGYRRKFTFVTDMNMEYHNFIIIKF